MEHESLLYTVKFSLPLCGEKNCTMLNLGPSNAQFKNHCSTHPLWNRTLFCLCHDKLSLDKKVDQRWVQCSHLNDDWRGLVDVIRGFPSYIRTVGTWGQSWGGNCSTPDFGRSVYPESTFTPTVEGWEQNMSATLLMTPSDFKTFLWPLYMATSDEWVLSV